MDFNRRELLKGALLTAAAGTLSASGTPLQAAPAAERPRRPWEIVDTNVSLFQWPFRRLPCDTTDKLVGKLRSLRIGQAWAGSFEGILHRDLGGGNARLAAACRDAGHDLLVPFGSVNVCLPDWKEDLRRCHEEHRMPGIRLHPGYHDYTLGDLRFERLLAMAAERGLLVQVAVSLEDPRTQHPRLRVPDVDLAPLPDLLKKIPGATVMLLGYRPPRTVPDRLAKTPAIVFDIARVEATDGIARLIRAVSPERVLFGTHAPFLIYESALIKVYESDLSEAQVRLLLGGNAQRLLANSPLR